MLKWLVIGVGDITRRRVLPAILREPRSMLAGIVTRDPAKAEPYQVPAWTDLAAALNDSGADAVYVASPVFLHARQTIASLRAGKHVLCEKPMAMHYAEAQTMEREAAASGKILGVAYYRRMYPKVNRAKALIDGGAIGRPVFAQAILHTWFEELSGDRDWLVDPQRAGGGPLYDNASHRIDLLNYLLGKPVRVSGHMSTLHHALEVEDNATALIDYESGARGVVDVRWHSRVLRDEFRIIGTDGEIDLSPLNTPGISHPGGREEMPAHDNLHYPCIENFVGAVLDGTPLRSSVTTALQTDWVTDRMMALR